MYVYQAINTLTFTDIKALRAHVHTHTHTHSRMYGMCKHDIKQQHFV